MSWASAHAYRRSSTRVRDLLAGHPIASYFVLAYAVSWSAILLITVPHGIPGAADSIGARVPFVFLAMLAGPTTSSLIMSALADGRAGLRELAARLTCWHVGLGWYAAALLAAPVLLLVVLGLLSLGSPAFLPALVTTGDRAGLVGLALVAGLGAGLFEEIGWTGFVTPRLLRRRSVIATGLLIGAPWWAWHILADYWGGASYGGWYLPHILLWGAALPAYRVLMTWVYSRTGSVLVAALMHAAFTGGQGLLGPAGISPADNVLWYAWFALALWLAVGLLAVAGRHGLFGRARATISSGGVAATRPRARTPRSP